MHMRGTGIKKEVEICAPNITNKTTVLVGMHYPSSTYVRALS
jgi:hypothetical protein